MMITTLQVDVTVSQEGGGGGASGIGTEITPQPVMRTVVRNDISLHPLEVNSGADSTCNLWKTLCCSRWMWPKEALIPWRP